jgi:hypothetical protein
MYFTSRKRALHLALLVLLLVAVELDTYYINEFFFKLIFFF